MDHTVHGIAKSQTRLNNFHFTLTQSIQMSAYILLHICAHEDFTAFNFHN